MKKEDILRNVSLGLGLARSLNYTAQSALLPLIDTLTGGLSPKQSFHDFSEHMKRALPKAQAVLREDAENISRGIYPLSVLFDEDPLTHYSRLPLLIKDAVRANTQRKKKQTHSFSEANESFVTDAPDYYRRNFHFQDGGYLSSNSARLYDHQVEILFSGTAQAMRRQIIPRLKEHFGDVNGRSLKFLEVASGTGALTRAVALAFPEAKIVCLDPSPHYLKRAEKRLMNFRQVSFVQGYGEDLDFKDDTFDAVFSCYLFHELPREIRTQVLREKFRVVKPGGLVGLADSLQKGDDPDLDWALERFPVDFHEPFYKNYIETRLEPMIQEISGSKVRSDIHFLTKVMTAVKEHRPRKQ